METKKEKLFKTKNGNIDKKSETFFVSKGSLFKTKNVSHFLSGQTFFVNVSIFCFKKL